MIRPNPAEDWSFTAQQAVEKLLKARIVPANRQDPRLHDFADLALLSWGKIRG